MDYKKRIKYQRITLPAVTAAGNTVETPAGTNTDIDYKHVTGVVCTITGDENGLQNSVFNRFTIDQQAVFSEPETYEAKLLMSVFNTNVSPYEKYYRLQDSMG